MRHPKNRLRIAGVYEIAIQIFVHHTFRRPHLKLSSYPYSVYKILGCEPILVARVECKPTGGAAHRTFPQYVVVADPASRWDIDMTIFITALGG